MLGTGLASLMVVGGLTFAVQRMKRPTLLPAAAAEELSGKLPIIDKLGPPPKLEAIIPVQAAEAAKIGPAPKNGTAVGEGIDAKPAEPEAPGPEPEPVIALDEANLAEPTAENQAIDTCGTSIRFMRSPQAAARRAALDDKLVLLLHVSGNFEDSGFT
jgi:hypothetical protein